MSYRNDHDAALARIDALEAELARVQRDRDAPQQPPRARRGVAGLALAATACAAAVGFVAYSHVVKHDPPLVVAPAVADLPLAAANTPTFAECRARIEAHPVLTAVTADPHGPALDVHAVERTGAACRKQLEASTDPSLAAWARTEFELAGDISRIIVYYEHDPYTLDGYSTANQLWKEYDAAIVARDAALARLAPNS